MVNLLEEGIDVGVRIGELPVSGLCAAPGYLARQGTPLAPADLADHVLIAASAVSPIGEWRFGSGAVRVAPRLSVTTNDAAIEAAVRGLGIARLLSYQVAHEVAAGQLVIVLAGFEPPPLPVHVVHHEGRHESAKVRVFVDLAAERLRAALEG